jgi:hypothetical protein
MTRTELQLSFYRETGTECFNTQGEPYIDYVQWLEDKVLGQPHPGEGVSIPKEAIEYARKKWFGKEKISAVRTIMHHSGLMILDAKKWCEKHFDTEPTPPIG